MAKVGRNALGLGWLMIIFFTSCQKEISAGGISADSANNASNTGNPNGLLIKLDIRGGTNATDSAITYYVYDTSKRLISLRLIGSPTGGISTNSSYVYSRNANGIITQVVQKTAAAIAQGIDSTITKVFYDAAAGHYTYSLTKSNLISYGITTYDSTVYAYDGTGKLSQYISYERGYATIGYAPLQRFDFTYTAGQFTAMKAYQYDITTISFKLVANYNFTYDSNINPIQYGVDAPIIIYSPESVNNSISETFSSTTAGNFSLNTTYTYNAANKPATAKITKIYGSTTTQKAIFYYQ